MKIKYTLLLIFLTYNCFAQKYEIAALNIGASINSSPTNNMYYKGNQAAINYSTNILGLKNIDYDMQLGVEIHILQLSRLSYEGPAYTITGNDTKQNIYSEVTTSLCGVLNKKIYADHGYYYCGISMGGVEARNILKKGLAPPRADYIAPDFGYGPCFGVQGGYTYYYSKRWALDVQISIIDFDLDYNAQAPVYKPVRNLHYNIVAFTSTVGFRYAFGFNNKLIRGYTPDKFFGH